MANFPFVHFLSLPVTTLLGKGSYTITGPRKISIIRIVYKGGDVAKTRMMKPTCWALIESEGLFGSSSCKQLSGTSTQLTVLQLPSASQFAGNLHFPVQVLCYLATLCKLISQQSCSFTGSGESEMKKTFSIFRWNCHIKVLSDYYHKHFSQKSNYSLKKVFFFLLLLFAFFSLFLSCAHSF